MEFTATLKLLDEIGIYVRDAYKSKLKAGNHVATGKLYNSISYKITTTTNAVKLEFKALPYYINIEDGRKAGSRFPPPNAIKRWCIKRGLPSDTGTVYTISRSIAKNGIRPSPYLREIKKTLPSFTDDLEKAFRIDLEAYLEEQIKTKTT